MQKIPPKRLAQLKDVAMFAFVIFCVLFTVWMLIWGHISTIGRWLEWQALHERGVSISAEVMSLEQISSARSQDSCAVVFAYQSETGATLSRETRTTSDFCAVFSPGSIVDALYLPEDPTIADLTWASGYVELQVFMLGILDGILLLAFGWVWLKAWLSTRNSEPESAPASDSPPPLHPDVAAIYRRASELAEAQFYQEFETLRDELVRLPPACHADLLRLALQCEANANENNEEDHLLELLVYALTDLNYRPALPHALRWLGHANDEICFSAAILLDAEAGGRFGIAEMIEGGWVQYDQIRAIRPQIEVWWQNRPK